MKLLCSRRWLTVWLAWLLVAGPAPAGIGPFIITPPARQTNYNGTSVSFTVTAGGDAPLFYFWQKDTQVLTNGGKISGNATTNLTVANLSVTDAGTYSVTVSNAAGTISTGAVLTVYTRLVQNGGFETGDFSGWTRSGNTGGLYIAGFSPFIHTGSKGTDLGPPDSPGYLSQTIPTIAGQCYLISFWLWLNDTANGVTPNRFSLAWDGHAIVNQTNMAATDWTNWQFRVSATSTNETLSFGFQNDSSYFGFDDVSVQPVPTLQPARNAGGQPVVSWNALAGFRYQLLSCTNLSPANWSSFGGVFFSESNVTATVSNTSASGQQFFRALLLP